MDIHLLDIVSAAGIYAILALSLNLIVGCAGIASVGHAAFCGIGAYATAIGCVELGWNPWTAMPFAFVVGFFLGLVVERLIIRPLYARPLDAILATWGLGIVIGQVITIVFGRQVQFVQSPMSGAIELFGISYSAYRLTLFLLAAAIALA